MAADKLGASHVDRTPATLCVAGFIAAFSVGPGVCVWLALSELMPTRIRTATLFLPETRGKSLEEIERLFARPGAVN